MKGSEIILTSPPRGVFDEGIIDAALKPGQIVEITPNTAFDNGRPHWRASSLAAGTHRGIAVLVNDSEQGQLATTAYVANTRCFVYWPASGEELNLLMGNIAGTGSAEDIQQGQALGVDTTGKLIVDSTYNSRPFEAMEPVHGFVTADFLLWVKFRGPFA